MTDETTRTYEHLDPDHHLSERDFEELGNLGAEVFRRETLEIEGEILRRTEVQEAALTREQAARLAHVRECETCTLGLVEEYDRSVQDRVFDLLDDPQGLPATFEPPLPLMVEYLLEAFRSLRDHAAREAPGLARHLLALPPQERLQIAAGLPPYSRVPVAEEVLEEIPRWWHRDPHQAGQLAGTARALLEPFDENPSLLWPFRRVQTARVRSWALLGNALRVRGVLGEAGTALDHAMELLTAQLRRDPGLSALQGQVHRYQAALFRDCRYFDEATEEAKKAQDYYRAASNETMVAWMEAILAFIEGERGQSRRAVQRLERLLTATPRSVLGEKIFLAANQNLCQSLVEVGRPAEALERLRDVALLPQVAEEPLMVCRITWVEGLARAGLGQVAAAVESLRRVIETFREHAMPYDAALAGLDLALVLLRAGRAGDAGELAGELVPVFLARGVHREATAAGLVLMEALEERRATEAQVREVSTFLQQARRDPSLTFRPSA